MRTIVHRGYRNCSHLPFFSVFAGEHSEAEQHCEALQQRLRFLQAQLAQKRDALAVRAPLLTTVTSDESSSSITHGADGPPPSASALEAEHDAAALEPVLSSIGSLDEARPVLAFLVSQVSQSMFLPKKHRCFVQPVIFHRWRYGSAVVLRRAAIRLRCETVLTRLRTKLSPLSSDLVRCGIRSLHAGI